MQEGEIDWLGGTRSIKVRVIAATNRNLAAEVENGNFRADLLYKLNDFLIERESRIFRFLPVIFLTEFKESRQSLLRTFFVEIYRSVYNRIPEFANLSGVDEINEAFAASPVAIIKEL